MSISTVNRQIQQALQNDGGITADDAKRITSRQDDLGSDPVSVGDFLDEQEYNAIFDLYVKVERGDVAASPEANQILNTFLQEEPDSRFTHVLGGGSLANTLAPALGIGGGLAEAGAVAAAIPGAITGAAIGFGMGALHGLIDD